MRLIVPVFAAVMFDIQMCVTDGTWFLVVDAAETCSLKCCKMNSASCGMFPTLVHSLSLLLLHYCSEVWGWIFIF